MINTNTHTMRFTKKTISAASIKKAMKTYGISVKRCRQNKEGVLVVVSPDSKDLALTFFNEFNLTLTPNLSASPVSCGSNYVDFGTLFNFVKI